MRLYYRVSRDGETVGVCTSREAANACAALVGGKVDLVGELSQASVREFNEWLRREYTPKLVEVIP